jgi:hypothetical protein
MRLLGISASYFESAAAIGTRLDEPDHVVFYDRSFLKFERLMETYIALARRGFRSFRTAIPPWLIEKLFQKSLLKRESKQFAEVSTLPGSRASRWSTPIPTRCSTDN